MEILEFRQAIERVKHTDARWQESHQNGTPAQCFDALQDYIAALRAVGVRICAIPED